MRSLILCSVLVCCAGCVGQNADVGAVSGETSTDFGPEGMEDLIFFRPLDQAVEATVALSPSAAAARQIGVRSWGQLPSRSKRSRVTDWARDVIMSAAADFDVPSDLLYGIWCVESGRLNEKWHRRWQLAKRLPQFGSACARRYGIVKCRANWEALQRICAQERDGVPICDPNQVKTSRALAMGPMQHLPVKWSPGPDQWAPYVVDFDHDGVYDPHGFADAVGSSAGHLRHDYELGVNDLGYNEANAWRHAARMYLGQKTARRYERKVYRYARNWCAVPGYCD